MNDPRASDAPVPRDDEAAESALRLTYAVLILPQPLTVSIPGMRPRKGALEFVLTNQGAEVLSVKWVKFTIQVGSTAACLTPTSGGIRAVPSDITNWNVIGPAIITSGPALFTLQPAAGAMVDMAPGTSTVVSMSGIALGLIPGTSTISIRESINGALGAAAIPITVFSGGLLRDSAARASAPAARPGSMRSAGWPDR